MEDLARKTTKLWGVALVWGWALARGQYSKQLETFPMYTELRLELEFTVLHIPVRGRPSCSKQAKVSARDFHRTHVNESCHNESMHYNRRSETALTNTELPFRILRVGVHNSLQTIVF